MKKVILLCMVFVFSNVNFAQNAKIKTEKKIEVKTNNASETGQVKSAEGKAKAETNKDESKNKRKKLEAEEIDNLKDTKLSKAAEKKVKDKVTGKYKGKKVYTGPKGGKYYINKNGNKTYLEK